MRLAALLLSLTALAGPVGHAEASPPRASERRQDAHSAQLEEYTAIFVDLATQALANPRLASPMPCLPHWLAGNDHVVVAVSEAGAAAGLRAGDLLRRIGQTPLTGRSDGVWDVAMRALESGAAVYTTEVAREGFTVTLALPCDAERARRLHAAERAMWTAVTSRDWQGCIDRGRDMIAAFGGDFSPPLMIMGRCASARSGVPDGALTSALGHALLSELIAHPDPPSDLREQLSLVLQDLDAIRRAGGDDYAGRLRARMAALGVNPF